MIWHRIQTSILSWTLYGTPLHFGSGPATEMTYTYTQTENHCLLRNPEWGRSPSKVPAQSSCLAGHSAALEDSGIRAYCSYYVGISTCPLCFALPGNVDIFFYIETLIIIKLNTLFIACIPTCCPTISCWRAVTSDLLLPGFNQYHPPMVRLIST